MWGYIWPLYIFIYLYLCIVIYLDIIYLYIVVVFDNLEGRNNDFFKLLSSLCLLAEINFTHRLYSSTVQTL